MNGFELITVVRVCSLALGFDYVLATSEYIPMKKLSEMYLKTKDLLCFLSTLAQGKKPDYVCNADAEMKLRICRAVLSELKETEGLKLWRYSLAQLKQEGLSLTISRWLTRITQCVTKDIVLEQTKIPSSETEMLPCGLGMFIMAGVEDDEVFVLSDLPLMVIEGIGVKAVKDKVQITWYVKGLDMNVISCVPID